MRLILRALRAHRDLAPRIFWIWATAVVFGVLLPLAITVAFGFIIGGVPGAVADGWSSSGGRAVIWGLGAMAILDLGTAACHGYSWQLATLLGLEYRARHHDRLLRTMLEPEGVAHVHDPEVLDAVTAADNVWVKGMLEGIGSVAGQRIHGAGAIILISSQHLLAGLLLGTAWIVYGTWAWRRATVEVGVVTAEAGPLRRANALRDMGMDATAAKEVRLFGLARFFSDRFDREWWEAMERVWRERREAVRYSRLMPAMLGLAHAVALGMVVRSATTAGMKLTGLSIVLQAVFTASRLGSVPYGHYEVEFGLATIPNLERLERLVAASSEVLEGTDLAPVPARTIRFEDVWFHYPGGDEVLRGLDLEIPVGASLAIVGDNGAGKTTLVQLLARLRDPTKGRITVDGIDLTTVRAGEWQRRVAAVSQDALRLPSTAAENVAGGRSLDREALDAAAASAGATSVIDRLERGWLTMLDRGFTDGTDLSGGQWQRIALARALAAVRADASLLVLDEPTAHMDARAEADLYARFLDLTAGCTTVLISHRFSTVRQADRIVVLAGGRVVEVGTHDELVALGGRYAEMFRVQAARFVADDSGPITYDDALDAMDASGETEPDDVDDLDEVPA
ncbi:MAG TPA: ABC transporter ATP-binding protein [Acidimicrobiales bacterium]|nr:ABC transporter ATP-binding protein [Acidimicrobiales bacterium]